VGAGVDAAGVVEAPSAGAAVLDGVAVLGEAVELVGVVVVVLDPEDEAAVLVVVEAGAAAGHTPCEAELDWAADADPLSDAAVVARWADELAAVADGPSELEPAVDVVAGAGVVDEHAGEVEVVVVVAAGALVAACLPLAPAALELVADDGIVVAPAEGGVGAAAGRTALTGVAGVATGGGGLDTTVGADCSGASIGSDGDAAAGAAAAGLALCRAGAAR
jgi:hypothetical protein